MIAAILPGSQELHGMPSGRGVEFRLACIGRYGISVPKYAVGFYKQYSTGKNDEDESKSTFAILGTPDDHTGHNVMLLAFRCNIFSAAAGFRLHPLPLHKIVRFTTCCYLSNLAIVDDPYFLQ
jgi:hypothetical protein